jgi:sugar phosphate isomerase/epimerase
MARKFSCREPVYGTWQDAVQRLPQAGICGLEASMRPADDLQELVTGAQEHGVEVMTLAGGVNLDSEESVAAYLGALDAARQCGVPIFFTSANGTEREREHYMGRLRELAQEAEERSVVISLETHPPFCQNADQMLETVGAAGHSHLKINLDTANIFYYNEGLDSADELERVIDHVASLHLKDTDGGFHSANFPVFGEGVVQWERVFATLDRTGFDGPLTIELEGPLVGGKDLEERHAAVVACMDYLRSLGVA